MERLFKGIQTNIQTPADERPLPQRCFHIPAILSAFAFADKNYSPAK
jgi:hypothetical protein